MTPERAGHLFSGSEQGKLQPRIIRRGRPRTLDLGVPRAL